MNSIKKENIKKERRAKRVRAKISGTAERPRLSIYRSNQYLYAQAVDDEKRVTVLSASTRQLLSPKKSVKSVKTAKVEKTEKTAPSKMTKTAASSALGEMIAKLAKEKGVTAMVFDRGSYRYHGRVKAVAEAIRAAGIAV